MSVIAAMAPFSRRPAVPHMARQRLVGPVQPGPGVLAPQHRDLLAQHQQFRIPSPPTSAPAAPATRPRADEHQIQQSYRHKAAILPAHRGHPCWRTPRSATYAPYWRPTPPARREMRSSETRNRSHGGARVAAHIGHPAALIAHQTRTITPARGSNRSGNRCAARAAHLPQGRPAAARSVLLGCRRAGCPAASSWSAMGRCGSVSA